MLKIGDCFVEETDSQLNVRGYFVRNWVANAHQFKCCIASKFRTILFCVVEHALVFWSQFLCRALVDAREFRGIEFIEVSVRVIFVSGRISTLLPYIIHYVPVESNGAAKRCGCPFEKATPATTIKATQKAIYRIKKKQSRHLRSSVGPSAREESKGSPR